MSKVFREVLTDGPFNPFTYDYRQAGRCMCVSMCVSMCVYVKGGMEGGISIDENEGTYHMNHKRVCVREEERRVCVREKERKKTNEG